MRRPLLALAALVAAVGLARPAAAQDVMVFAASSLTEALGDVAAAFTAATGIAVTISYAGSSALARQIEAGAPADVFVSADSAWMDYLAERDLIAADSRFDLLGNRLVLVQPAAVAPGESPEPEPGALILGLLGDGRLAMADVEAVPAGRYGKAALELLGVWNDVEAQVVQADNVRSALAFVALGEAPLGIVYATDALVEPAVRLVATFAEELHPAIVYPVAVTAASTNPDARTFLAWLTSLPATAIFADAGFLPTPVPG